MKPLIRYFFKGVHAVVGPLLLGLDRLTAPRGLQRDTAAQQQVDEQTRARTSVNELLRHAD